MPFCSCSHNNCGQQIFLSFRDRRLHIEVSIDGHKLRGLFDPGSCCSKVGQRALRMVKDVLLKILNNLHSGFVYPNCEVEETSGMVSLPVEFLGYKRCMQCYEWY